MFRFGGNEKTKAIKMARTTDHAAALAALADLRSKGWLADGSMKGQSLAGANLSGADFSGADLTGVDFSEASLSEANFSGAKMPSVIFSRANLSGATIGEEQMVLANQMAGATMPDGSRYDGRYGLQFDLVAARTGGARITEAESMAKYYEVSVEAYKKGQEWAKDHLQALLQKARAG